MPDESVPPTPAGIPKGLVFARTTPEFDSGSVPAGLLKAHKVAKGVWGNIVVEKATVKFHFENSEGSPIVLTKGDSMIIPPSDPHHVELGPGAIFRVEFYGPPK